ncbi:MAG TPA: ATP-binding cassette domain-containing protein [Ktedonobacteraceae bacterium]|nr:ATP-binding cassette domain-containing protein [Ktedonobacteraceae bacterium]
MMQHYDAPPSSPVLQVNQLTKRFGGLLAVDNVSLSIYPGEVVGLLGDNGAGKSTLIKLISGVHRPDDGSITFNGSLLQHASPLEARQNGIETIYQDLALCENLDAPTNIFLGREPTRRKFGFVSVVDRSFMHQEARQLLAKLDIRIPDLSVPMLNMSGGQRQAVAIARALYWNARLMIMDEPTAALGVPEQMKVLDLVRRLRAQGIPVILISHNLQDVFAVADRVIVLRRGCNVGERRVGETDSNEIVGLMVGAQ